jgi:hypothetical protein
MEKLSKGKWQMELRRYSIKFSALLPDLRFFVVRPASLLKSDLPIIPNNVFFKNGNRTFLTELSIDQFYFPLA